VQDEPGGRAVRGPRRVAHSVARPRPRTSAVVRFARRADDPGTRRCPREGSRHGRDPARVRGGSARALSERSPSCRLLGRVSARRGLSEFARARRAPAPDPACRAPFARTPPRPRAHSLSRELTHDPYGDRSALAEPRASLARS
jgi:hypothetical protein